MCELHESTCNGLGDIWWTDNPIYFSSIDTTVIHLEFRSLAVGMATTLHDETVGVWSTAVSMKCSFNTPPVGGRPSTVSLTDVIAKLKMFGRRVPVLVLFTMLVVFLSTCIFRPSRSDNVAGGPYHTYESLSKDRLAGILNLDTVIRLLSVSFRSTRIISHHQSSRLLKCTHYVQPNSHTTTKH